MKCTEISLRSRQNNTTSIRILSCCVCVCACDTPATLGKSCRNVQSWKCTATAEGRNEEKCERVVVHIAYDSLSMILKQNSRKIICLMAHTHTHTHRHQPQHLCASMVSGERQQQHQTTFLVCVRAGFPCRVHRSRSWETITMPSQTKTILQYVTFISSSRCQPKTISSLVSFLFFFFFSLFFPSLHNIRQNTVCKSNTTQNTTRTQPIHLTIHTLYSAN